MYSQTDAKAHAETGSRISSLVVSTICRIPNRQTEWSTGDPSPAIILLWSLSDIAAKLVLLV